MKYLGIWIALVVVTLLILTVSILIDYGKIKSRRNRRSKQYDYEKKIRELGEQFNITVNEFSYQEILNEHIHFNFTYEDKVYDFVVDKKEIYINNNFIKCKYVESAFEKMMELVHYILNNEEIYNYKKEIVNL